MKDETLLEKYFPVIIGVIIGLTAYYLLYEKQGDEYIMYVIGAALIGLIGTIITIIFRLTIDSRIIKEIKSKTDNIDVINSHLNDIKIKSKKVFQKNELFRSA